MKFYIDSDFKCHTTNVDASFREFDMPFFDGKCQTFIEGYRYIPQGESRIGSDGVIFCGETFSPWKSYEELDSAQRTYEKQRLIEYSEALKAVGVKL